MTYLLRNSASGTQTSFLGVLFEKWVHTGNYTQRFTAPNEPWTNGQA